MFIRILFSLLLVAALAPALGAQTNPCADLAKKHLATLDEHLDLDYGQMKCLKEKSVNFCDKNRNNPPTSASQRKQRLAAFRKALLECLNEKQRLRVTTHYRNVRDERARRNLLQAFLEEFGGEVIIIKRRQ